MHNKSISQKNLPDNDFSFVTSARDMLDAIEMLAVLASIPMAYFFAAFIINNFDIPFYTMEYKLFFLRHFNYFNYSWNFNPYQFLFFSFLILVSWYILSRLTIMAKIPVRQKYLTTIVHFLRGYFYLLLILILAKFILNLTSIPIIFISCFIIVSLPLTLGIRLFSISEFNIYRARGNYLRHVIVIADENYTKIIDKLLLQKHWGFRINSIITGSDLIKTWYGDSIPVKPDDNDIKSIIDNEIIDEVIYCKKDASEDEIHNLVNICNEVGVIFRFQSSLSDIDPMEISLKTLNKNGKLALVDMPSLKLPLEIKTLADFYLSLGATILLFPLFLLIAILIRIDSKGPVFFKQERIGLRGRKFNLYKFRTMVENAEELGEELREKNEMDGPAFKMKDDPRITRLGGFLRKTGLDEFPQLLNVIRGEMSLIGPRPPIESEVKQYERWHLRRLSVKPGITCTWQIMPQRNDIKFEKWMDMDLNYIDNWSLGLDARLFFKTISAFFTAGGR